MGEAPRVIYQKLIDAENPDSMAVDSGSQGRTMICERFSKIEKAQRALHPLAIQLMKEKKAGFGLVHGHSDGRNGDNDGADEGGDGAASSFNPAQKKLMAAKLKHRRTLMA